MNEGEYETGEEIIDRWFGSNAWKGICSEADRGDADSLELMEHISLQLSSLIFHADNRSDTSRIEYELRYFTKLCEDFDVPSQW